MKQIISYKSETILEIISRTNDRVKQLCELLKKGNSICFIDVASSEVGSFNTKSTHHQIRIFATGFDCDRLMDFSHMSTGDVGHTQDFTSGVYITIEIHRLHPNRTHEIILNKIMYDVCKDENNPSKRYISKQKLMELL